MAFSLKGYLLEPPRVGASNSQFTFTPNNFVSNSGTYSAAYPSTETNPRTDYLVFVEGDGLLPDATFCWTKNEGLSPTGPAIARFDYAGREQAFRPLKGSSPIVVGTLSGTANTTRLKVSVPIGVMAVAPFRLAVGDIGSGTTFTVSLVTSFGSPSAGTVELLTQGGNAGELNWNAADLVTFDGEPVRFQRQAYFTSQESNGRIGPIGNGSLILNPLPATGQTPLIRIGYGLWLIADEVASEGAFSVNPTAGHVEWARTTGLLKFNSTDISTNAGRPIYYDGTVFARGLTLPRQSLGTVNAAGTTTPQGTTISSVPPAGGDLIFRVPGVIQFAESVLVTTLDPVGKQGVVQYKANGEVQISLADRTAYGGQALQVVFGDLPIERGVSMRFFRSPVNLDGSDPNVKDVSSIYEVESATWSDPIIGVPQVLLPAIPVDDLPIAVRVDQGSGSFVGPLPRQDVVSPPGGLGYVIDFDAGQMKYTRRLNDSLIPLPTSSPILVLPDPLLIDSQLEFELETAVGSGVYTPLVRNEDYVIDLLSGQLTLGSTSGETRAEGTLGSFSGTTFTDTGANFTVSGVVPGDYLVVLDGSAEGIYTIITVGTTTLTTDLSGGSVTEVPYEIRSGKEILADRFFQEVLVVDPNTKVERIRSLGTITNSPRKSVPLDRVDVTRFTFTDLSATTTIVVANDAAFTAPGMLAAGTIEVSEETGNLNFSQADVTAAKVASWVFKLTQGSDYRISAILGLIQFTERMFSNEEVLLTYTSTSDPSIVIEERATFLVRKEQSGAHPVPVSTVTFNPTGHEVASNPPPKVYRGGRPQVTGTQVNVDTTASTVTFLPDNQLTDALPHGATLNPNERVLIDYYVYDAIGGEQTTTVLQPPINLARVFITQGSSSFTITGNWTSSFPTNYMLKIEAEQVYLLAGSSYDSGTNLTTINLAAGQTFRDDFTDPKLFVSSGQIRITSAPFQPSYFVTELSAYDPTPRGMNLLKVSGDRTSSYKSDVILLVIDGSFTDTYQVSGAKYNSDTNRTEISLTSNTLRQYTSATLKYSVRPVFGAAATSVSTSKLPVLVFPEAPTTPQYLVFRRIEGQIGQILKTPDDYEITDAGVITLKEPLKPGEEISIFYTGMTFVTPGVRLKASYTHTIAPNPQNGLEGQVLRADFSTFSPDNFYYRVETMTRFRLEYVGDLEASALSSSPSGGPTTSNASSPQLHEQGRPSFFFDEYHAANQDIIARAVLKHYNDAVNYLEDSLHEIDGRVVGDRHGRFKFDNVLTNPVRTTYASVTNQIDDLFRISPFPSPSGTVQSVYKASPFSRFFCTVRNLFAGPTVTGVNDRDPIAKLTFKNLASVPGEARRRAPRARILKAYPAGTTTFEVDNSLGTSDALLRPAFQNNTRVIVQDAGGTTYINAAANVTVTGTSVGPPQTITLSGSSASPIPAGATIYLSPTDASTVLSDGAQNGYAMVYRFGKDIYANLESGELLWAKRVSPYDGSFPETLYPKSLWINEIPANDILQVNGIGLFVNSTSPYRVPALFGKTTDDDGDQSVPILGPTFTGEIVNPNAGALYVEKAAVEPTTGTLRTSTTPPFLGVNSGSLDVTRTIITNAVNFPSPVPKVHDLVRILSGTNGATSFRRITAVTANTVTVDSAFALQDTNFTYTITVSSLAVTGTATLSGTSLTDGSATFTTSVKVGQTVVLTSSADVALRRQIVAIVSNTVLTLDAAFSVGSANYRVDNPLGTFGGTNSVLAGVSSAVGTVVTAVSSNNTALTNFLTTVFTTVASGSTGAISVLTQFTDLSANFITSGVTTSHFLYIPSGLNAGVYKISAVNSATQLTIDGTFVGTGSSITYQVNSSFGASFTTLQEVLSVRTANSTFFSASTAWQVLVNTPITVLLAGVTDSTAFARGILTADVDTRSTDVNARITALGSPTGPTLKLENILASTEKLYDKRFAWVDARINLEKGLLVIQQRAADDRAKAIQELLNQLIKLLAVS